MHNNRRVLSAFVALTTFVGIARADDAPRLRASWKEKYASVVAFSPDGRSLVSSGADGLRLRDAGTGRVRAVLAGHSNLYHGSVFSPDGRYLLAKVASDRHKPVTVFDLKVWVAETGKEHATFPHISEQLNASTDHFALSGDGMTLAFLDSSERLPMVVEKYKAIFDGRHEVEGCYNASPGRQRLKIWDVRGWKETATVDAGPPMVFSPDGKTLVTGTRDWRDPTAKVWDAATGRLLSEFDSGAPWPKPLVFSPDGKSLAIGGAKEQVLYELATGRKWAVPAIEYRVDAPVFSSDGKWLFPNEFPWIVPRTVGGGGNCCYDLTSSPPKRLDLGPGQMTISQHRRRYVAMIGDMATGAPTPVTLRELPSMREIGRFEVSSLQRAELSPDGRWLAVMVGRYEARIPGPGTRYVMAIQLLDPITARVVFTFPSPGESWGDSGWKFSPDGKSLAVRYQPVSNVTRPGEADPSDRPMSLDIWELPPR